MTDDGPTWTKPCQKCGTNVSRWRGQSDVRCMKCGTPYNAAGQRLRDDWQENESNWDEEIDDLEGMERAELRAEAYESDRLDSVYFEPPYTGEYE